MYDDRLAIRFGSDLKVSPDQNELAKNIYTGVLTRVASHVGRTLGMNYFAARHDGIGIESEIPCMITSVAGADVGLDGKFLSAEWQAAQFARLTAFRRWPFADPEALS